METFPIDGITGAGIDTLIRRLEQEKSWLKSKTEELTEKLAVMGKEVAHVTFAEAEYKGEKDIKVDAEQRGEGWVVKAEGRDVLFVEFGAGEKYGHGHPLEADGVMGPGTYPIPPGKGHWNDPDGWYIPKSGEHTCGNPPAGAMYNSREKVKDEIVKAFREVFGE